MLPQLQKLDVVGDGKFTGVVTATFFSGTATTSVNSTIKSSSSSSISYPTFVPGVGSTILDINTNNLSFVASTGQLGIGTTSPNKNLDVIGDVSFTNRLFAQTAQTLIKTAPAIINSATPYFVGVDTSSLVVGYGLQKFFVHFTKYCNYFYRKYWCYN